MNTPEGIETKTYDFIKWIDVPKKQTKIDRELKNSLELDKALIVKVEFYEAYADRELLEVNKFGKFINKEDWEPYENQIIVLISPKTENELIHSAEKIASLNFVKSLRLISTADRRKMNLFVDQSEFLDDLSVIFQTHSVSPWQRKEKKIVKEDIFIKQTPKKINSKKKMKSSELINNIKKNSDFYETYEYAKDLGYIYSLNDSLLINYNDGTNISYTSLISEDTLAWLVNIQESNEKEKTFVINIKNESGYITLTMFNEEEGIEIDPVNKIKISSFGNEEHNSCLWSDCVQYCFDFLEINYQWYSEDICATSCETCVPTLGGILFSSILNPVEAEAALIATCGECISCTVSMNFECGLVCADNCYFYPCRQDCSDNEGYIYDYKYCKEGDVWKSDVNRHDCSCKHNNPGDSGDCACSEDFGLSYEFEQCDYDYSSNDGGDAWCNPEIECYSDNDCPADGWVDSTYCSGGDVWQIYGEYSCSNPGTASSDCIYSDGERKKRDCNYDCSGGGCSGGEGCDWNELEEDCINNEEERVQLYISDREVSNLRSFNDAHICGKDDCSSDEQAYAAKFDIDDCDGYLDKDIKHEITEVKLKWRNDGGEIDCSYTDIYYYTKDEDHLDEGDSDDYKLSLTDQDYWHKVNEGAGNCHEGANSLIITGQYKDDLKKEDSDTIAYAWWPKDEQDYWSMDDAGDVKLDIEYCKPCPDEDNDGYHDEDESCGTDDDCDDYNVDINPSSNVYCDCNSMTGGGSTQGTSEICDEIDNDCDGSIDEYLEQGCGVGICSGGTQICVSANNWSSCSTDYLINNETCNNLDDDCDLFVDENLTKECGINVGECVKGTQTCSNGTFGGCGGSYVGPTNETCNGLDDNCNNITDEANVCGDYPNSTLVSPADSYISYTGNITFNCSSQDNSNLANIILYHNINGIVSPNESKIITGNSNSTTWIINNIPDKTNFTWNCLVYDNDSHWSWAGETSNHIIVDISNISDPSLGINLIYPTTDINVTLDGFFDFTAEVCCYDANCSEVNVSLDPEVDMYTPTTKTHCNADKCTKTIYSKIKFVYEDDKWKKIKDARSLKESGIGCLVDFDGKHHVECLDWNYTSKKLKFKINDDLLKNKNVPIKVFKLNEDGSKELKKEHKIKLKDKNDETTLWIDSGFDDEIHFGESSTTIFLQSQLSENIEDTYIDEAEPSDAHSPSATFEFIDDDGSSTSHGLVNWNISSISSGSVIEEAKFGLYFYSEDIESGDEFKLYIHHLYNSFIWFENHTWNDGVPSSGTDYNSTSDDSLWIDESGEGQYYEFDVRDAVQTQVGNDHMQFFMRSADCAGDPMSSEETKWYQSENSGATYDPYLNITYTAGGESSKGLISTTEGATPFYTNVSNPYNITLNQDECQNITWNVNATGGIDTYTFFVYANKTSNMSISNKTNEVDISIEESVESPPQILLDFIYPTTDINVTQNEFFNLTVNITCIGADCSEINVSLDPEVCIYTPTTENHCKNGICNKLIYSGIKFVYEDYTWKKIEDARSLKGSGIDCIVDFDGKHHVECLDWNYTSRKLKFKINDDLLKDKNVPIKVFKLNEDGSKELKKEQKIKLKDKDDETSLLIDSDFDNEIHFGESSTTIILSEEDNENLDDSYIDINNPDNNYGDSTSLYLTRSGGGSEYLNGIIKFDMVEIPNNASVIESYLSLYLDYNALESSEYLDIDAHLVYSSYNWLEESITWNNGPISGLDYDSSYADRINIYGSSEDGYYDWDVKSIIQESIGGEEVSIFLNSTGHGVDSFSDYVKFRSKEYSGTDKDPYLNITYTETSGLKDGLVSTTIGDKPFYTNVSNPYNLTLNEDESQLIIFWVNASGTSEGPYKFFVYANKTSDMSIGNQTEEINITINVINSPPEINSTYPIVYSPHYITEPNGQLFNITYIDNENDSSISWYLDNLEVNNKYSNQFLNTKDTNNNPSGIDKNEEFIWVVDSTDEKVYKYTLEGIFNESFNTTTGNEDPVGITQNGTYIWITDNNDSKIYRYYINGTYTGDTSDLTNLNNDSNGIVQNNVYFWIVDSLDAEIYKYYINGTYSGDSFDTFVNGNTDPGGITSDGTYFWITDKNDTKVYRYYINGTFIDSFDTLVENNRLGGVMKDDDYVWVSDTKSNKIYKYFLSAEDFYFFEGNYTSSGSYNVTVIISDPEYLDSYEWNLTVYDSNILPSINSVAIFPFQSLLNDPLNCSFIITDDDNDSLIVNVTWFKNDQLWTEDDEDNISVISGQETNTSSIGDIEAGDTNRYDKWICSINSYDGSNWSGWENSTEVFIDPYKFYIRNSASEEIAYLDNLGNMVLEGNCMLGGNCTAPADSFIIANSTDNTAAYIDNQGNLCIEKGDCSDQSASCNPTRDAFIIRNSSNYNMSYIDFDGDLCLIGGLYENINL